MKRAKKWNSALTENHTLYSGFAPFGGSMFALFEDAGFRGCFPRVPVGHPGLVHSSPRLWASGRGGGVVFLFASFSFCGSLCICGKLRGKNEFPSSADGGKRRGGGVGAMRLLSALSRLAPPLLPCSTVMTGYPLGPPLRARVCKPGSGRHTFKIRRHAPEEQGK